jgi:hypothetical protein
MKWFYVKYYCKNLTSEIRNIIRLSKDISILLHLGYKGINLFLHFPFYDFDLCNLSNLLKQSKL